MSDLTVEIGFHWAIHKHLNRCLEHSHSEALHSHVEMLKQMCRPFMNGAEEEYQARWDALVEDDGFIDRGERMVMFGDLVKILFEANILSKAHITPEQLQVLEND